MTVVLHIGTHKTGTTAIQRFAASKRSKLRSRGLWYPSYDEIGLFVHYGHHHVAHAIANENGNRLSIDDARRFADYIQAKKRRDETVLISAEPFYRHLLPAEGGYWAERKAYIDRVRTFFPSSDVKVLAIVRRQDTFARSLYQERIKVTKYRHKFRDFLATERPSFEYYNHLRAVQRGLRQGRGPDLRRSRRERADRRLLRPSRRSMWPDIPGRPSANPSLPIDLVEFKRILNTTPLKPERLKEIGILFSTRPTRQPRSSAAKVDWLSVEEMAAFYDSFAEQNEKLRAEFLPGRPPPLFPPFVTPTGADVPEVYGGMSANRLAHLVAELLL